MARRIKEKKPKRETTRKQSSQKQKSYKNYIIVFVILVIIPLLSISAYMYMEAYQQNQKIKQKQQTTTDELMHKMKKMLDDEKQRLVSLPALPPDVIQPNVERNTTQSLLPKESVIDVNTSTEAVNTNGEQEDNSKNHDLSEVRDYSSSLIEVNKSPTKRVSEVTRKKYPPGTTPKLAIIIDDVSFAWQTKLMKEIPYKITPAFFPPTTGHPETVKLSHEFDFAMIHLPLEAKHYKRPEEDTLNVVDSSEVMVRRIQRIKKWFPHISYYNNHTGGYFTSNYAAMEKLLTIFRNENLMFVDSRTAPDSKAPEIFRQHKMQLLSRDVFLDNSLNKADITEQLKKAVQTARKHGYAIAIGHPHKNTLEVLRDSKELLNGLDLVFVKDL
ncbi:MAG: divergent polysaccharide deacetylase family protein [Sulfurospirillaceae bacterium]|nr:divergent polysaccharide deacetylase family protein [Sulfurospirillaceae bacterium]MDD2826055.1 divergent polysaccharide deacetylase family protein [Sulfurospirillaceae bacterium]